MLTGTFQYVGAVLATNQAAFPIADGVTSCFYRIRSVAIVDFPDPRMREAVSNAIVRKYEPAGDIYDIDVENITDLDASFYGITNADGIDQLNNLLSLNIQVNSLLTLDVSGLSKLQNLECRHNNLTNLNASGSTQLKTIEVSYNNLTNLDLSGCSDLRTLKCPYTSFTTLENVNVTGCTNLQSVWCFGSGVTNLNITGCTNLQYLDADGTPVTDLSSLLTLASRGGLATNAYVELIYCPLTDYAKNVQIPILRDTYGVSVNIEVPPPPP